MSNLEIIGEAVKNLSSAPRKKYPDVAWRRVAVMRNVLIHEYFGVDLGIVWNVIAVRLPALKRSVSEMLSNATP